MSNVTVMPSSPVVENSAVENSPLETITPVKMKKESQITFSSTDWAAIQQLLIENFASLAATLAEQFGKEEANRTITAIRSMLQSASRDPLNTPLHFTVCLFILQILTDYLIRREIPPIPGLTAMKIFNVATAHAGHYFYTAHSNSAADLADKLPYVE